MSEKILIIDDEQDIADLLEVYLKNENYIVYKFYCATDAMSCIESGDIDLAILDIMLPDMNGFSLCQLIRKKYTYPIIMLTAKIEETDKITGLTLGADDYVTKPFRPLEVVAGRCTGAAPPNTPTRTILQNGKMIAPQTAQQN